MWYRKGIRLATHDGIFTAVEEWSVCDEIRVRRGRIRRARSLRWRRLVEVRSQRSCIGLRITLAMCNLYKQRTQGKQELATLWTAFKTTGSQLIAWVYSEAASLDV